MKSLRQQLTFHLLKVVIIIWLFIGTLAFFVAREEMTNIFDQRLIENALLLKEIAHRRLDDLREKTSFELNTVPRDEILFQYKSSLAFRIWRLGTLVAKSSGAPKFDIPIKEGNYTTELTVVNNEISDPEIWFFYAHFDEEFNMWLVTGELEDERQLAIAKILWQLVWPAIIGLAILMGAIYLGIKSQLLPLRKISLEIRTRNPNDLVAISSINIPLEIHPVINALNSLFLRLSKALETEKEFTCNASHEMRTPLAAMKTQLQVAAKQSDDKSVFVKVEDRLDRLIHLVDQLLILAKLEPFPEQRHSFTQTENSRFNSNQTCQNTLIEFAEMAKNQDVSIELVVKNKLFLSGSQMSFSILLRNLVDNAIRYSNHGGQVTIILKQDAENNQLQVIDRGIGIDDAEKPNIFARFQRGQNQTAMGSGIGLSIVKRIVKTMNGQISLTDNPLGGTIFTVTWPSEK